MTASDRRKKARPELISVMVQLDKVEVHELKPKVLTKDEGGLVWGWTSN